MQKTSLMVTFGGWGWREKQEHILQKQSPGYVLQKRCSTIFGKLFLKKFEAVGLQLYFKRGSCIVFFCGMFKTLQNCFFTVHLLLVNLKEILEKAMLKKPSLVRVKSHGFYRSLLQRNFIWFSLRKTFSLNLLLKSDFKRCLG